tara:strand:+ start:195 stop:473 length:279 start_codon:yes stop_codon:yes gene_type:complete
MTIKMKILRFLVKFPLLGNYIESRIVLFNHGDHVIDMSGDFYTKYPNKYKDGIHLIYDEGYGDPVTTKEIHMEKGGDPEIFDEWIKTREPLE